MIAVHTWAALVATPLHPSADVAARGWDGGGGRDSGKMALVYIRAMETGRAHTHVRPRLRRCPQPHPYVQQNEMFYASGTRY